jgi:hypothetical protein
MSELSRMLWNIFVELRKEILLAQETRAKYVNFKITFVSACIGLIFANLDKLDSNLLLIPAIAAIFFDLLINSYTISTKRIGFYCRHYIEPGLLQQSSIPKEFKFWESYINQANLKQSFSLFGNVGLTLIIILLAAGNAIRTLGLKIGGTIAFILIVFLAIDVYAHLYPTKKINNLSKPDINFDITNKCSNQANSRAEINPNRRDKAKSL